MYCTLTEVRRRASGGSGSGGSATTTALPDVELEALIEQASRYFDLVCGVEPEYFEAAGASVSNLTVYGDGTRFLKLSPYLEGSLNNAITLPDGYTAPVFTERHLPDQPSYLILSADNGVLLSSTIRPYYGWDATVPIVLSARWGFTETPKIVNAMVIELVLNLWRETDPATVKLVGLEGQPLRERMPPRMAEVCRRLRVTHSGAAAFV